jgi:hypothetical protein
MDMQTALKVTGIIVGLAASIYTFVKFIDSRIKRVIQGPEFLKELSRSLRPFAIFDEKERILVDRGAMDYIESIEVRMDATENLPKKIIVHPTHHLDQAPILIPLDTDMSTVTESRGKKFDWVYDIEYHGYNEKEQRKYSIEVIKSA